MKIKIIGILIVLLILGIAAINVFLKTPDPALGATVLFMFGWFFVFVVVSICSEDFLQRTFGREKYDRYLAIEIFESWCGTLSCRSSYCLAKEGWAQTFEYGGEVGKDRSDGKTKYSFALPGDMSAELVLEAEYMETERGMTYSRSEWCGDRVVSFILLSRKGIAIAEFVPVLGESMRFVEPKQEQETVLKVA